MAKGRKMITSRSEIYLGSYGYNNGGSAADGEPDLHEDEVWSMVDDAVNAENHFGNGEWGSRASSLSGGSFVSNMNRRPPPRSSHHQGQIGGLSLAFDDSASSPSIVHQIREHDSVAEESPRGRRRHLATSAPVNVPDWSKIYRVDSVESLHDSDDGLIDDDSVLIPPHEYLARQYASSRKAAANSVVEGVGRTLKGRDMSRVRDAVWNQTGFYG